MKLLSELRKIEIKTDAGWTEVAFNQIEQGDVFRMFEPDGAAVVDEYGRSEWVAYGPPAVEVE